MRIMTRNFKPTFDVLKAFKELSIDDLTFRFDTQGFRVKSADRGMTSYLDAYFKASGFDEFEANNEILTVSLFNFLDFTFNKTDRITISNFGNFLTLKAESDTVTNLSLPLLENPTDNTEAIKIDTIKIDSSLIELDFKAFKTILKNYLKEDSVIFEIKEFNFGISTDRGQETKVFKGTDIIKEIGGKAKSKYSMGYLKLLNKLDIKTFSTIKIEFKSDFPAIFTLQNDNIKLEYVVAPKVVDNE